MACMLEMEGEGGLFRATRLSDAVELLADRDYTGPLPVTSCISQTD